MAKLMRVAVLAALLGGYASTSPVHDPARKQNLITPLIDTAVLPAGREMDTDIRECNYYANRDRRAWGLC